MRRTMSNEIDGLKFVAVEGAVKDWALYYGPSHWPDEQVQSSGKKVPSEIARLLVSYHILSYYWDSLKYRD